MFEELNNPHRLITRQINKSFPNSEIDRENLLTFLRLVNESYHGFDDERRFNKRVEEISSQELAAYNEELKLKNSFLDSFNHGMAHDVKNHTSNILGLIRMLKKYTVLEQKEMTESIVDKLYLSANQLSSIVGGFLYLSKAEGNIASQYELINQDHLKKAVDLETHYLILGRNIDIIYTFGIENLVFSEHILRIVLVNLISNSIKFSKPNVKGVINVSVRNTTEMVELIVNDNGLGMDLKSDKNKLYRMFSRNKNASRADGHGLGLFMVKKIIEFNQGTLDVQSEPNVGTKFIITFPLT